MRTLLVLLFCAATLSANAQETQKIGYADWNYIFTQMPEFKQIENELKTHGTQLENQLKAKSTEFENKLRAYQGMPATTPDAIKADKERELQALQESIQKFQQDAQTSLGNKQTALMDPVFKKVGKAIEDVAKENGYSFILNPQLMGSGEDIVLYSDEKYDISNLVLKKLGVTPKPETAVKPN
ncbi:MAG: OmpH family outer membrane protein [Bacteroidetes bacterium CHB5]|nr:OmpH family outer membrane protein [Bacteroidetes bacterium CHB5]